MIRQSEKERLTGDGNRQSLYLSIVMEIEMEDIQDKIMQYQVKRENAGYLAVLANFNQVEDKVILLLTDLIDTESKFLLSLTKGIDAETQKKSMIQIAKKRKSLQNNWDECIEDYRRFMKDNFILANLDNLVSVVIQKEYLSACYHLNHIVSLVKSQFNHRSKD